MFRKTLALALVAAMLLVVAPIFPTATAAEGDVVEIELLTGNTLEGVPDDSYYQENFVEKYIREAIGVDIVYTYAEDLNSTLNLRILSGDMPDLTRIPNRAYLVNYVDEEFLLCYDDYADQLQNAFAFTAGNIASGKVNGKTYAIPGRPYGFRQAYWYNTHWFDQIGYTADNLPTTLDEYVEAVRKLVNMDIDGNGIKDTVGHTGAGWDAFCQFFGAYGCTIPNVLSLNADGDVVDTMLTDEFYAALSNIAALWQEGIFDPEIFSLSTSQTMDKVMTRSTASIYVAWPSIKKVAAWQTITEVDPDASWEIIGPLTGPDGVTNFVGNQPSKGFTSLISANAELVDEPEKLNAALALIDFTATEEGLSLLTYGVENQHWDYNAEGVPTVRPEAIAEINFSWVYQLCGREELSYCRVKFGEDAWKYVVESDEQPYLDNVSSLIDDPDWYNATDAETYIKEECAKFVTGERKLDEAEWASFLQTLDTTYKYGEFVAYANDFWHEIAG